jgi:hypothetical protein
MYLLELSADDLCGPVTKRTVASSSPPAASPQMPPHTLSVFRKGGSDRRLDEDFFEEAD